MNRHNVISITNLIKVVLLFFYHEISRIVNKNVVRKE